MTTSESNEEIKFPLLDLPVLVLEKVLTYITDPYDLKALRGTCGTIKNLIDRKPEVLLHLKVTPRDLKDLENLVKNESQVKWNNFRFPPALYYIGCRRHYVETFNRLFSANAESYAPHIQILEMDRFDLSNVHHIGLLGRCQKLKSLKIDAMMLKGVNEERLQGILEDEKICAVLEKLEHLDVTAFEFLVHDYQYRFMGNLLQKCKSLESVGSWGYFPEWEQPIGGHVHLQYFVWPLLQHLRIKLAIVDMMLRNVETSYDLARLQLQFLNDTMDWQSSKWILDLKKESSSDYSSLETFLYSRIKSYSHRAVGWFDDAEFEKSGLSLMTNLTTIHIHNTRDVKLSEEISFNKSLFPKLENLTLIVGNRLTCEDDLEQNLALEKVVVNMLLNSYRPTVKNLTLDINLDHHHEYGSITLPLVITNFPNLKSFCVEEWGPTDEQMIVVYKAFPQLEVLMFCGRNLSDVGIIGCDDEFGKVQSGIQQLKNLRVLKMFSVRLPPKNVFPWPTKENNSITDKSFIYGFSQMQLRKFHFFLKSELITLSGLGSLVEGEFIKSALEFSMNWLPQGLESAYAFQRLHPSFRFLDQQTFLEPGNFVIPDIGKWVL